MKTLSRIAAAFGVGLIAGAAIRKPVRKYKYYGRVVAITGGSRGLGLELARQLAEQGAEIALLARDRAELMRARRELRCYNVPVNYFVCDVSDEAQVRQAMSEIVREFGRIDVLINNAGTIQVSPLAHVTKKDFDDAMAIHFYGPLATTQAVLPYMRRQRGGRIINISSIGGKVAVPHLLPYSASKFALVGYSEGLRAELRRENIVVTTICPGLMRTGSPPNVTVKGQHQKEYAWFSIADSLPGLSMQSRRAARKILAASALGRARLVLGWPAKAAVLFHDLMPETFSSLMAVTNHLLPDPADSGGQTARLGRESESRWSRQFVTDSAREATAQNNEFSPGQS